MFVSGITGLAGLAFAPVLPVSKTILLFVIFFLSYGFGQALTDCFQIDTDSLSSPYRPLTQGLIRKQDVLLVSLTGLGLSGLILTWAAWINLPLALLAVFGLATYTYFKRRWWAGPFYNAWIVLSLALIACTAGYGRWPFEVIKAPDVFLIGIMIFFGYANFVLVGYFKDVSADRQTGYFTQPVVFGFKIAALISDGFACCTLGAYLLFTCLNFKLMSWPAILFGVAGCILLIYSQIQVHLVRSETESYRAVVPVVHTYLLILSSVILTQKPSWGLALLFFYAGFVLTMKFRPERNQI
jgi:4-hydroxybenzoate polyprenyltransferase